MAIVHEKLYGGEDFSSVELRDYLEDLTAAIASAFRSSDARITITRELEQTVIDLDRAVPLGLIVSEIITNSFRHAFPAGGAGAITLRSRATETGELELELTDDGVGRSRPEDGTTGLGSQLISILVEQIGGRVSMETEGGTRYMIRVPLD